MIFFVLSILPGTSHFKEFWSFQVQILPWKIDLSASISNLEVKLEVGKQFEVFCMFSNNEFDYLTDNFRSSPILDNFRRLHPTWTRCAALFAFPSCPILYAKIDAQIWYLLFASSAQEHSQGLQIAKKRKYFRVPKKKEKRRDSTQHRQITKKPKHTHS